MFITHIIKEFKEFALRGNLIDMAVAFVMGATFEKVVSAFIDGMVMPIVGEIISGSDFTGFKYILEKEQLDAAGKIINSFKRTHAEEAPVPAVTTEQKLLIEIRDLLKKQQL